MDGRDEVFEVFAQPDRGEPHTHVGSLIARDADFALCLAKELFCRRGEAVSLWVVPRGAVAATSLTDDELLRASQRTYRLGEGYRVTVEKRRRLKEAHAS